ncbi:LysM peptidoglycan-binding domain-containing protein [Paenibacillus sp. P96]|uniref:LysM peptidoglycan-binding domain-containing protein n=1 Tax=Paenibacillus zeirhizosphaerae TaxID=2987519 RepID=A0ABT9FLQ7_9BACL|nr:LysM peptidoglycan-binding domain-containing protein [Paenibacillus sp. P96]MDP4095672.1 LysM peptidoglycan-binding domain-containing protein [Paenibacillus sp. P96]
MDNRPYGLRFDIYERVHLTEDVAGIAELEEIELVPRIQVVTQGEHAALRGHLQLQGVYRGEENEIRELHHQIPVEITIPMNRVTKLEDIAMEIENFDVDLLSLRSLNITGVLTLYGVDGTQTEETPDWGDDEYTAVHTPAPEEQQSEPADRSTEEPEQEQQPEQELQQYEPEPEPKPDQVAMSQQTQEVWNPQPEETQPTAAEDHTLADVIRNEDQEIADFTSSDTAAWQLDSRPEATMSPEPPATPVIREPEVEPENEPAEQFKSEAVFEHERPEEPVSFAEPSVAVSADVPTEDKKEPKVAFGSKKETDAIEAEAVPFSSLIASQRTGRDYELVQDESSDPSSYEEDGDSRPDSGKWKNLFQHGFQEETPFRRVKLCIVQREETLETIAERYELSARELQMHNRLSEQNVEEGQVLYIP